MHGWGELHAIKTLPDPPAIGVVVASFPGSSPALLYACCTVCDKTLGRSLVKCTVNCRCRAAMHL